MDRTKLHSNLSLCTQKGMRRRAISTLDKDKWSPSHPNQFIPGECAPAPTELIARWVPDSVWTS